MMCPLQLDLVAFAKGELSPSEQEAVRAHLPACVDCQEELDAVNDILAGIAALPSVRPSEGFAARVTRALSSNVEYVKLARETRRREKEETVRKFGWWGWAGKSLCEKVSSTLGWIAAAAAYLVTFGTLAWLLIPGADRTRTVADGTGGTKPELVSPPVPEGDGSEAPVVTDPLAPGGKLALVETRTSQASRKQASVEAARAIERGLAWLVSKQKEDGSWSFGKIENTALATLALLGDGHRSSGGRFRDAAAKALAWLRGKQAENGAFDEDPLLHALATIAAIEDLAFREADKVETGDARRAVEAAIGFCRSSQYEDGSWGAMQATAKSCEALRLAKALRVKKCDVPLERAGAYLAKAEPDGGADHAPWALACAWTGTPGGQHGAANRELPKSEPKGLLSWWLFADSRLVFDQPFARDEVVFEQTDLGHWRAESGAVDDEIATALAVLLLEAPYRVVRVPGAR